MNIGRRVSELAVTVLTAGLLWRYCIDVARGTSSSEGSVAQSLRNHYSVQQLEAMQLWQRMDAKVAAVGGCGGLVVPRLGSPSG